MALNGSKSGRSKSGTPRKNVSTRDSYTRKVLGSGGSLTSVKAGASKPDRAAKYKKGI